MIIRTRFKGTGQKKNNQDILVKANVFIDLLSYPGKYN